MSNHNDELLVTSSASGAELRVDPPFSVAPSHPTSSCTNIVSSAAATPIVGTQIKSFVPHDKPQRSVELKPQFVEQYGPSRLSDYHNAYSDLVSFVRDANIELQRDSPTHIRSKELYNQLMTLTRVLTTRMNALRYMQLSDDSEATYSALTTESETLARHLSSAILPLSDSRVDSESTAQPDTSEPQVQLKKDSNLVPHHVTSGGTVNLSYISTLSTSIMHPGRPQESSFQGGVRDNPLMNVDFNQGNQHVHQQTETEKGVDRSSCKRSAVPSTKSTSSSSSKRRIKLSEARALEVKQRAELEREKTQLLKQQVQEQLDEARIKAKLEKEMRNAQLEAEEARWKAQKAEEEAQLKAQWKAQKAEEEAQQEIENQRKLREIQNQLAAIKAKEEHDARQAEIDAALAAAAVLEGGSRFDEASTILSSLPKIDKVHDLYLNRPGDESGQIDGAAEFDFRMPRSSSAQERIVSEDVIDNKICVVKEQTMNNTAKMKTEITSNSLDKGERFHTVKLCAPSCKFLTQPTGEVWPEKHKHPMLSKRVETKDQPLQQPSVDGRYIYTGHSAQIKPPQVNPSLVDPEHNYTAHERQVRCDFTWGNRNGQGCIMPEAARGFDCHATSAAVAPPDQNPSISETAQNCVGNPVLRYEAPVFVPAARIEGGAPLSTSQQEHPSLSISRREECSCVDSATPAATDFQAIVKSLAAALAITRLPVPKPPVFKGDPLAYPSWIAAFKHLVSSDSIKPEDKMLILRDYIDGPAKQAVGDLYFELSEESYNSALEILQKRFGEDYTIAESLKEKLESWPHVKAKDYASLMNFADYLKQCEVMSRNIQGLAVLDDPSQIKKLLQKLPDALSMSWGGRVVAHQHATGRYPEFKTFVSFLQEKADCLHNAHLKQNQKRTPESDSPSGRQGKGVQTFTTSGISNQMAEGTMQNGPPELDKFKPRTFKGQGNKDNREKGDGCVFCQGHHHVFDCKKFAAIEPEAKREFIRKNYLCHRCLHNNHFVKGCRAKYECKTCKANHNTILHDLVPTRRQQRPVTAQPTSDLDYKDGPRREGQVNVVGASASNPEQGEETKAKKIYKVSQPPTSRFYSLYVPVYVSAKSEPHNEILVYAMLDTMSDTSFVVDQIADRLPLQERDTCLTLTTLTSTRQNIKCKTYSDLRVRAYDSHDYIDVPTTYSHKEICTDKGQIPTNEFVQSLPHLKHLANFFYPLFDAPVALLLGVNVSEALRPLQVVSGEPGQPYAQETRLGWGVVGKVQQDLSQNDTKVATLSARYTVTGSAISFRTKDVTNERLIKMMEQDFVFPDEQPVSQEDQRFLQILNENIKVNKEGHYELPLPFKGDNPQLPNNRHVAYRRLMSLKRKFSINPEHFKLYKEFMDQMLERHDAEIVPDIDVSSGPVWFVPHHGVYNPNKPGKIRVVFDCAATCQGTSLNDHLLSGPDLMNSLTGVLCRFRLFPIAVSCDVERMFHQFHVAPHHRDYLRFLWWPQNDLTAEPVDHRMRVHLFGAASSPGCANFALKQLAKDNCQLNPSASAFIQQDFYVDDGLHSDKNEDAAIQLLKGAQQICKKGNLHLHKIASNSQKVMSSFPETEVVQTASVNRNVEKRESAIERALGIRWSLDADSLYFNNEFKDRPLTKRGALSMIASIFDPLGLVSPLVLRGRHILQEACREKLDWDDPLPSGLLERWISWVGDLKSLSSIQVPRCYFSDAKLPWSLVELHHFADASNSGYGECSYLRVIDSQGNPHCSMVMAKSKVAPLRTVTVPRLELQAAVLAVKIARFLQREFEGLILQHHFWTDSKVVLGYIYNETKRFHIFVANRVQQIRDFSSPQQWHHIPTDQNPADHASRGLTVRAMNESNWYSGPHLLNCEPIVYTIPEVSVADEDREVKALRVQTTVNMKEGIEGILTRFSSVNRLLKVISCIMTWAKKVRQKETKEQQAKTSPLEETHAALMRIVRCVQSQHFPAPLRSTLPELRRLDVFVDERGTLRVGGRLAQSVETHQIKHPYILPKDSHLSVLLARHHHQKNAHQGRTTTIGALRTAGVWICGARRVVSAVIHRCVHCSRLRGKPEMQKMADLPQERTEVAPPFTHTGLDCFGPFHVAAGRKEVKRYGLIFTCLASRAVHLEVLEDMSTDAFICGLRRFVAIRGNVKSIRCDRGTNFIGGERELRNSKKTIDGNKVRCDMQERSCDFNFNTPSASHFGGVWERLIRKTRGVIEGLLREHGTRLTAVTLPTLFYEVAAIINNRPLCADSLEDPSAPAPLTPNHLLTIKPEPIFPPPGNFQKDDLYSSKRWRRVQYLVEQFWHRWRTEYVHSLQPRKKWHDVKDSVCEGMVVILTDENTPRGTWKLGRIEKVYPGRDGLIRSVQLRLSTVQKGQKGNLAVQTSLLDRPIHKIIPLQVLPP